MAKDQTRNIDAGTLKADAVALAALTAISGYKPANLEPWANFLYAFSVFEFAVIREIRVKVFSTPHPDPLPGRGGEGISLPPGPPVGGAGKTFHP